MTKSRLCSQAFATIRECRACVVVAKRRTVVTFGLGSGPRVSRVSTVTGIGRVLLAKRRTVIILGRGSGPRVSNVPMVTGIWGSGRETQNCRHFWTCPSRLKSVNRHNDLVAKSRTVVALERRARETRGDERRGDERRGKERGEGRGEERGEGRRGGRKGGEGRGERGDERAETREKRDGTICHVSAFRFVDPIRFHDSASSALEANRLFWPA